MPKFILVLKIVRMFGSVMDFDVLSVKYVLDYNLGLVFQRFICFIRALIILRVVFKYNFQLDLHQQFSNFMRQ